LLTTYPRERWYRQWWLSAHSEMSWLEAFEELARKFPNGLSEAPELPEERSGEVSRLGAAGARVPSISETLQRNTDATEAEVAFEEELV
jgi:hypothetical protein